MTQGACPRDYIENQHIEHNYLYVDHRQRGLGSHSCGPEPEEAYELPIGRFHWSFVLQPDGEALL